MSRALDLESEDQVLTSVQPLTSHVTLVSASSVNWGQYLPETGVRAKEVVNVKVPAYLFKPGGGQQTSKVIFKAQTLA